MILFTLKCAAEHRFEAWFRDNAAYDRQQRRGLITCPDCGSNRVEKAPMAPRLGRSDKSLPAPMPPERAQAETSSPSSSAPTPDESMPSPAQVRHALQVLRRHIEKSCENVGDQFAAEARRIHKGEAKARGIYGEATPADTKALLDDGIEVAAIPWVPTSDA